MSSSTVYLSLLLFSAITFCTQAATIPLANLDFQQERPHLWSHLDKVLKDKRVVFLGESSHWLHEKYDYRLILLNYLVTKGFTHIGMEMGISDGARINRYFQTGEVRHLNQVRLYSTAHVDANGVPEHISNFWHSFVAEEKWFYQNLRMLASNKGKQIHHFGFDLDMIEGGGYEDLIKLLTPLRQDSLIAKLMGILETVADSSQVSLSEKIFLLKGVEASLIKHDLHLKRVLGKKGFANFSNSLKGVQEALKFTSTLKDSETSTMDTFSAMARRERFMFSQLDRLVKSLPANAKVVLMGHNFHLSKASDQIFFVNRDHEDKSFAPMWKSIGAYATELFPNAVFSIWLSHNRGRESGANCNPVCKVDSGPGFVGNYLAQMGSLFWVDSQDLASSDLQQRLNMASNDQQTQSGFILPNANAIFFIDEVSPLRPR